MSPQQFSDCGHDRSHLDFNSDRDIQCKVCWENREILIQRLIEPFEHALETLKDDGSVNNAPEPVGSGETTGIGRTRSLRRRAGKKRTRSVSPQLTPGVMVATTPMKLDGEDLLRSGGLGTSKPEEEDCIHVQDISVAIPRPEKKRSKSPEQNKMMKIAALEPQKASTNIITPAAGKVGYTGGGSSEELQENPPPPVDPAAAVTAPTAKLPKLQEKSSPTPPTLTAKQLPKQKPRTSLPPKGGQRTLYSFFTKSAESAAIKSDNTIVNSNFPKPAPISVAGGGGGGAAKKKEVVSPKVNEEIAVRKSTPPPARAGTRKSAREFTVKSRGTVNYREDSDSDIDLE